VHTLAGEGSAELILPGLAMGAPEPPSPAELSAALEAADLVVVENLCSLPLNQPACELVARQLRSRQAVLHHHDLAWQRPALAHLGPPPHDPAWVHVTINELSRRQLAQAGIPATTIYNCFDTRAPRGERAATRRALGLSEDERVLLQPTRAIPRKNIPGALRLAEAVGATYWLLGPAEEGYGPELARLVREAKTRVVLGSEVKVADAYAACDAVVLASTWEGFGNPAIESAIHERMLAVGDYPVAAELASFGFEWIPASDPERLAAWLARPDASVLEHNLEVARRSFDLSLLPGRLEAAFKAAGWSW